jgi:cobalamin biosynthesis Mg chelatase CobN
MDDTEVRVKANVATTSVAPEIPAEVTTTTVAVDTPIEITSPPEIVVDPTATDYSCTSECVKGIAAAAGLPDGVVSVSVDGGAPVVLTGENAVALTSGSSKLEFSVAANGTTKSITSGVKRSAGAKQTDIPAATSDTTVAPAEESDTTVAASDTTAAETETETETSDDSSGSSPILWIIIALIVIAVIAYLVRRSQASKA